MHHTLGNGEFDLFRRMAEPVVCAFAVMTPQNVASEVERLIFEALYHRRPVYMVFPADFANQPVLGRPIRSRLRAATPAALAAAAEAIATILQASANRVHSSRYSRGTDESARGPAGGNRHLGSAILDPCSWASPCSRSISPPTPACIAAP